MTVYKMVPETPTARMLEYAGAVDGYGSDQAYSSESDRHHVDWWQDMLAAAPSPWQPIGKDQRNGQKIIAIGRDIYGEGPWRTGVVYWNSDLGLHGRWQGLPFSSSCVPSHYFPWPDLPQLTNED